MHAYEPYRIEAITNIRTGERSTRIHFHNARAQTNNLCYKFIDYEMSELHDDMDETINCNGDESCREHTI